MPIENRGGVCKDRIDLKSSTSKKTRSSQYDLCTSKYKQTIRGLPAHTKSLILLWCKCPNFCVKSS